MKRKSIFRCLPAALLSFSLCLMAVLPQSVRIRAEESEIAAEADEQEEKEEEEETEAGWAEKLINAAQNEIGYEADVITNSQESQNGETGEESKAETAAENLIISKYGEWAGTPTAAWCTLFIGYCLNAAGIPEEDFPFDSDVYSQLLFRPLDKGFFISRL